MSDKTHIATTPPGMTYWPPTRAWIEREAESAGWRELEWRDGRDTYNHPCSRLFGTRAPR